MVNTIWSIQEDLLKTSLPLIKAIEKVPEGQHELKSLLSSTGSLLGSSIQRLSTFRQRHSETFIKDGHLRDVKPSMDSIYGIKWQEKVEEEDKLNKVTQKALKSSSSTAKPGYNKSPNVPYKKKSGYPRERYNSASAGHHSYGKSRGYKPKYNAAGRQGYRNQDDTFRAEPPKNQFQPKKFQKN